MAVSEENYTLKIEYGNDREDQIVKSSDVIDELVLFEDPEVKSVKHLLKIVRGKVKDTNVLYVIRLFGDKEKIRWPADDLPTNGLTVAMTSVRVNISDVSVEVEKTSSDSSNNNESLSPNISPSE